MIYDLPDNLKAGARFASLKMKLEMKHGFVEECSRRDLNPGIQLERLE